MVNGQVMWTVGIILMSTENVCPLGYALEAIMDDLVYS